MIVYILAMTFLSFDNLEPKPKQSKKSMKIVLGSGALVGVIAIGSTLAASINLNAGAPVEFGQGVAQTVACDDQIIVTPYSKFVNRDLIDFSSQSVLDRIDFSGVDLSKPGWNYQTDDWASQEDQNAHPGQYVNDNGTWTNTCSEKQFIIKIYTNKSQFVNLTVDGNINSPVALNQYLTPSGNELLNRAMLISAASGDQKFQNCYAEAVDLENNEHWNYDYCYDNNWVTYETGSHSGRDNATLHFVVTDNPDYSDGYRYFNTVSDYQLIMGAPASAVDSITIESLDDIPSHFN